MNIFFTFFNCCWHKCRRVYQYQGKQMVFPAVVLTTKGNGNTARRMKNIQGGRLRKVPGYAGNFKESLKHRCINDLLCWQWLLEQSWFGQLFSQVDHETVLLGVVVPVVLPLFRITFIFFGSTPMFLFKFFKFIVLFQHVRQCSFGFCGVGGGGSLCS